MKETLDVSELLGTSEDESIIILRHFHWNKEEISSQWFEN